MTTIPVTPLENHVARKIGLATGRPLTLAALREWQRRAIGETLDYVRSRSPFYRRLLADFPRGPLPDLRSLAEFPFTRATDLQRDPLEFLCVSQDRIARIVTLRTSGTTQAPKRLFFTRDDLELTIDFFHHGMSTLVSPGRRVLILLPGQLPNSVGDLLARGLARMDVAGIVHGPVQDPEAVLDRIVRDEIDCLVGIPVQVLALARHPKGGQAADRIASVLLSTDYIPDAVSEALWRAWGCAVFHHYGMTEMGLGGGVACRAFDGYHLREADLFFEIVDPDSGKPVPDGEPGEVVFTTLTRQGMPLIRYRTGDSARFLPGPCPCGTVLPRMGRVTGRIAGGFRLDSGEEVTLPLLDEAIFAVAGVTDYQVDLRRSATGWELSITVAAEGLPADLAGQVRAAVLAIPRIADAVQSGRLIISDIRPARYGQRVAGPAKRRINESKGETSP